LCQFDIVIVNVSCGAPRLLLLIVVLTACSFGRSCRTLATKVHAGIEHCTAGTGGRLRQSGKLRQPKVIKLPALPAW